jgi:DNA-3-methyladenine glycosylase
MSKSARLKSAADAGHQHPATTTLNLSARFPQSFYERPTLHVCRDLIGAYLLHVTPEGVAGGRIVEAEAYLGPDDLGAHSSGGRRTERNRVMFGPGGYAYIFLIYGMYWCFNVVTGREARPHAILIRALEPVLGIDLMKTRVSAAPHAPRSSLCRGPGKLCRALAITRAQYGEDLSGDRLFLVPGPRVPAARVGRSPRINIDYAGEYWKSKPWRIYERGNPSVSGPPKLRL